MPTEETIEEEGSKTEVEDAPSETEKTEEATEAEVASMALEGTLETDPAGALIVVKKAT